MGVGNKRREFSRIGFQDGKFVEFLPTLRAGRGVPLVDMINPAAGNNSLPT